MIELNHAEGTQAVDNGCDSVLVELPKEVLS